MIEPFNAIGLIMSHPTSIKIGTIGVQISNDNLLIVTKIESDFLYCHRFRGNQKTIKLSLDQFEPLIY